MQTENKTTTAAATNGTVRTVTVVSTVGEKKKIQFNGTKWADLKKLVEKEGYSLNNMKAVEGTKKTTLEHEEAIVPEGDFRLFLMPYKSKAGASVVRMQVRELFIKERVAAKAHFGNWTQKSTEELEKLLTTYPSNGTKKVATEAPKASNKKAPAKKSTAAHVEAPKPVAKDSCSDEILAAIAANGVRLNLILQHLGITAPIEPVVEVTPTGKSQEEIEAEQRAEEEARLKAEQEEAEKQAKAEAKRKQQEEDEEDRKMLASIRGGLRDVK